MTITATSELHDARARWHDAREADLAADHGWLSLTGFHWLPDTATTLDDLPGSWSAGDGGATLTAAEIDGLRTIEPGDGTVEGTITATVAEAGSLPWVRHGDRLVELVLRGGRYAIRVRDPRAAERAAFDGIPTFDVDPSWIRPGRFTPLAEPKAVTVDTARADLRQQVVTVGTVEISFPDGPRTLLATAGQGGRLNLSFRDRTNGELTAPWRVVSTSIPTETGSLVVDFNRTVNLPFAFTEYGTCPAPVPENTLPLAVTAGELAPVRVTP